MDLSVVEDIYGNKTQFTYEQNESVPSNIQSAYPTKIGYNFWEGTAGVTIDLFPNATRIDTPAHVDCWNEPGVMDTHRLDKIDVKVGTDLARRYQFTYAQTADQLCPAPYNRNMAGTHKLTNVTHYASDGSSVVDDVDFSYGNWGIFFNDETVTDNPKDTCPAPYGQAYRDAGDPTLRGDPLQVIKPYLYSATSSVGGSVSFDYTRIPDTGSTTLEVTCPGERSH